MASRQSGRPEVRRRGGGCGPLLISAAAVAVLITLFAYGIGMPSDAAALLGAQAVLAFLVAPLLLLGAVAIVSVLIVAGAIALVAGLTAFHNWSQRG